MESPIGAVARISGARKQHGARLHRRARLRDGRRGPSQDRQRRRRRTRIQRWSPRCRPSCRQPAITSLAAVPGARRLDRRFRYRPPDRPRGSAIGRCCTAAAERSGPTGSWLARARSSSRARPLRQLPQSLPEAPAWPAHPPGQAIATPDRQSWPTDRDRLEAPPWHSPAESPARLPRSRTPADAAR